MRLSSMSDVDFPTLYVLYHGGLARQVAGMGLKSLAKDHTKAISFKQKPHCEAFSATWKCYSYKNIAMTEIPQEAPCCYCEIETLQPLKPLSTFETIVLNGILFLFLFLKQGKAVVLFHSLHGESDIKAPAPQRRRVYFKVL